MCALPVAGCGTVRVPDAVVAKIAAFHDDAAEGRFAEIAREFTPRQSDWNRYMRERAALGAIVASEPADAIDVTGKYRLVIVHTNTEFEHGRAVETFHFRVDAAGAHLMGYEYHIGKWISCPAIRFPSARCTIEGIHRTS
jgi:hypothetical protein